MYNWSSESILKDVMVDMTKSFGHRGDLARYVESQNHRELGNRIVLAYNEYINDRGNLGVDAPDRESTIKRILYFCQDVMNQICWRAFRLVNEQATGLNEDIKIRGRIAKIVTDHHFYFSNVHHYLAERHDSFGHIETLRMFIHRDEKIDLESGEVLWIVNSVAFEFEEAINIMTKVAEKRRFHPLI